MKHKLLFCLILVVLIPSSPILLNSQTWETLPNLPKELAFPVVTVLDGKIHVFGGGDAKAGAATNQHFCYDPATNKWKTLDFLPFQAQQPAGAANDGKIHFFGGGYPKTGQPVNSHYIYDVELDTWTEAAVLVPPRAIHYAVSVNDKLYSLAGQSNGTNQNVEYLCQVYDKTTDTWITKNKLPDRNFWYGAHVAAEGKIYRFGGGGYAAPVATAGSYDPESDTWSSLPSYPTTIHGVSGAAIGDKIFLAGGYTAGNAVSDMWMYDTKLQTYSPSVPLPVSRSYHFMVAIDSMIYCIGGNNSADAKIGVSILRIRPPFGSTSVEEDMKSEFSTIYSGQRLFINLPVGFSEGTVHAELYDLLGRFVSKTQVSASHFEMHIGAIRSGVYQLILQAGGKTLAKKVFVE